MTSPITASNTLVISAIISPLLTASLVWVNQRNYVKAAAKAEEVKEAVDKVAMTAAIKAEEVKRALESTNATVEHNLTKIVETGNSTHVLVNSQMGRALLMAATTLRALAKLTNDPEIAVAASNAEAELVDHRAKQATLDAELSRQRK
jgi:hypothetical protein